jgi:hypothetical protein
MAQKCRFTGWNSELGTGTNTIQIKDRLTIETVLIFNQILVKQMKLYLTKLIVNGFTPTPITLA